MQLYGEAAPKALAPEAVPAIQEWAAAAGAIWLVTRHRISHGGSLKGFSAFSCIPHIWYYDGMDGCSCPATSVPRLDAPSFQAMHGTASSPAPSGAT
jgi:hypothetical protein